MSNRNKGIRAIIPTTLTPAERKSDELAQWAGIHIDKGDWRSRNKELQMKSVSEATPEDDTLYDTPTIILPPPQKTVVKPIVKTKEIPFRYEGWGEGLEERTRPKNKFGHTASQKDKMINDQITRKPITETEKEALHFWKGFNDPTGKKMAKHVNHIRKKYDGDQDQKENAEIRNKTPMNKGRHNV